MNDSYYDAQQVCLNGHQQTALYNTSPTLRRRFCECGESTIHTCPGCSKVIKGYYHVPGIISIGGKTPVPRRCDECGAKFPWADLLEKTEAVSSVSAGEAVERLCRRFPLVAKELRHRHSGRPAHDVVDEYDVQDLLRSLLRLFFDDVREEEVVPSYAGKSARMDFLVREASIAIEAKMTRPGLGAREVGDQLTLDIARYQKHPDCQSLYCLIYDPDNRVRNPRGLESDLSKKHGKLVVRVFVVA